MTPEGSTNPSLSRVLLRGRDIWTVWITGTAIRGDLQMVQGNKKSRGSTSKSTLTYAPKDRIDHPVFGPGTLIEIDERRTTIDFDESGIKKFVTDIVELEPSDTPAPVKTAGKRKPASKKKTKRSR
jgi:hypothetical protein